MKRMIALMIALILCTGCLSGCFKSQIVPSNTEATEPVTEATEHVTEATEHVTEATEPATEATEPATEATEPATEATEPATEATESVPSDTPVGELSGDPFSFQVSINGTVFQLPCNVSDFAALGLLMEEDKRDNTLDEGYASSGNLYDGEGYTWINLGIYNNTEEPMLYENAMVDSVSVWPSVDHEMKHDVRICGGIGIGSTMDEIRSVFGEPTRIIGDVEDPNLMYTVKYQGASHRQIIEFGIKNGVAVRFSIDSDGEYQS